MSMESTSNVFIPKWEGQVTRGRLFEWSWTNKWLDESNHCCGNVSWNRPSRKITNFIFQDWLQKTRNVEIFWSFSLKKKYGMLFLTWMNLTVLVNCAFRNNYFHNTFTFDITLTQHFHIISKCYLQTVKKVNLLLLVLLNLMVI